MRSFAWFFGLILVGLAVMATLAYPVWELLHPSFDFPFHRVASRLGMLSLAIGFFLVARRLRLSDKASLGYGAPRPVFMRELLVGFVLGVVLMLPIILAMIGLDLRTMRPGVTLDAATLAGLALEGIARGLVVALIEETFLRGAMFSGIARESGPRLAIVLTALVYSATHFIGRHKIPAEEVTWSSGLDLLAGTLQAFANPVGMADAFLCLFAVGVLLGMVRMLTGNIAACIGLHAGWVWMITFMRETSGPDETSPYRFLLSRFDGFVGWLVLAWIVVIGFALYRFYSRRSG
jgi:membrane protease YdiL (CAAX protease family)